MATTEKINQKEANEEVRKKLEQFAKEYNTALNVREYEYRERKKEEEEEALEKKTEGARGVEDIRQEHWKAVNTFRSAERHMNRELQALKESYRDVNWQEIQRKYDVLPWDVREK